MLASTYVFLPNLIKKLFYLFIYFILFFDNEMGNISQNDRSQQDEYDFHF